MRIAWARSTLCLLCILLAWVLLVYLPHFHNAFQFDDIHTVVQNPNIRSLHSVPKFFKDATLFSVLPTNRVYRPVVSASLALDYWLGGQLDPFFFHVSTFIWFCVQLVAMFFLFRLLADRTWPDPRNRYVALAATAWYGLHPAMAETVNYVIQRADLYSTLGVILGVLVYARLPKARKWGVYLLPVAFGILSKPPALVFPAILFVYIWLFEEMEGPGKLRRALFASAPAILATSALGFLVAFKTPPTFSVGAVSAYDYRITQPLVATRYFQTFFAPGGLTADTDHLPVPSIWTDFAWAGFLFLGGIIAVAIVSARSREWKPVSFGLWWFLLALLPTSLFPLAEVENDHRMFFPFVGLVLAATWLVAWTLYKGFIHSRAAKIALVALCSFEFAILSLGTLQRNIVWRTAESLWKDVVEKSPRNRRGLLNYGVALADKGDYTGALTYLHRARDLAMNKALVEFNLGTVYGKLKRNAEAEQHFLNGLRLNGNYLAGALLYARWLEINGREREAEAYALQSTRTNPDFLEPSYLLLQIAVKRVDWDRVRSLSADLLKRFPGDPDATAYHLMAAWKTGQPTEADGTAENFLEVSALCYLAGNYEDAIAAAQESLAIRPNYAEAYSNIATAERARERWDAAEQAAIKALKLRPGFSPALNNLSRAQAHKKDTDAR